MSRSVLICAAIAVSGVAAAIAQQATAFRFDVAAIRQNVDGGGHNHIYNDRHNGEFRTVNAPLKMILQYAYDVPASRIVGAPPWVDSTTFDIDAKSDGATSDALAKMSNSDADQAKRAMVRALLEQRFGLATHWDKREMPIFSLVVAKGGPKFQHSNVQGTTMNDGRDHIDAIGSDHTLALLCESLGRHTGRVVIDNTGLDGRYSLTLKWTPDDVAAGHPGPDAPPDLFTALQEQLGLKLEPAKGAVPVLVIDKVTMPSEN